MHEEKGCNNWGWKKGTNIKFGRKVVNIRFDKGCEFQEKGVIISTPVLNMYIVKFIFIDIIRPFCQGMHRCPSDHR